MVASIGVIAMTTAVKRTDLAVYERLTRMDDDELVAGIRDMLGAKLTAYLGEVTETRTVRQWADGERAIRSSAARERLRIAFRAASLVAEADSQRVAQAWFQGLNPMLDDQSPARYLREASDQEKAGARVLASARQFAAVG